MVQKIIANLATRPIATHYGNDAHERARNLAEEAWCVVSLIHLALTRTNHIHEPELYQRLERIEERAKARYTRRSNHRMNLSKKRTKAVRTLLAEMER